MMKGDHGQINHLHDINWGEFDHASRAPQLMSCNYSVCMRVCVCAHTCDGVCAHACEYYMRLCLWTRLIYNQCHGL